MSETQNIENILNENQSDNESSDIFSKLVETNKEQNLVTKAKEMDCAPLNSEEEEEEEEEHKTKHKISTLIDSDSDSQNSLAFESNQKKNEKKEKPTRISSKKAMDDMKALMSETQRLHREATITIPYHKPKRRTLQEFLQRRTIIKPDLNGDGSPAAALIKSKSLKMTTEELEAYAQLMEERAKEATEFFKSETESEEENEIEDITDKEEMKSLQNEIELNENSSNECVAESQMKTQLNTENLNVFEEQTNELNTEQPFTEDTLADNIAAFSTEEIRRIKIEINESETDINCDDDTEDLTNEPVSEMITTEDLTNEPASEMITTEDTKTEHVENLMDSENVDAAQFSINANIFDNYIKNNTIEQSNAISKSDDFNTENSYLATQAVVTEVLELPKLDISGLHITPDKKEILNKKKLESEDKLKKMLEEKLMHESPTLKGDPNMLIDLETGDLVAKQPSGVDHLFKRLLLTRKAHKIKENETVDILSTENGKIEISRVQIKLHENENPIAEQKPRAAYFKLKENLKSIIVRKRLEEIKKKKEEEMEYNRCLNEGETDEENEYEFELENKPKKKDNNLDTNEDEDENSTEFVDLEADEKNDEVEKDDGLHILKAEDNEDNEVENDEATIENNEEDEDVDEDEDEDEDEDDSEDASEDENDNESEYDENSSHKIEQKRKNRIIKAFQDDSDDDMDLLQTPTHQPSLSASLLNDTAPTLFEDEPNKDISAAEQELLGLCSGNFGETQTQTQTTTKKTIISQLPITQYKPEEELDKELIEMCSGAFNTSIKTQLMEQIEQTSSTTIKESNLEELATFSSVKKPNKIMSSDEEEKEVKIDNISAPKERKKKFVKKLKKKKPKLGFSDDEESEEDLLYTDAGAVDNVEDVIQYSEEEMEVDVPETFVEYDSEENEIVVQMTKKEVVKQAEKFFDKEAELSDSEWGSADEDEKNMDTYDIEFGDEDQFDHDKLQTELGQIHARKMLDQDIKDVRKLQEIFFEDEENDGVGRQRQFKWKNAESGFSLDDRNNKDENDENAPADSGDEESEHLWRKKRYEREQFLKERGLKENSQDLTNETTEFSNINSTTKSNIPTTTKKLNIITSANATKVIEMKKQSPFLISKTINSTKTGRGSFLVRDKETLTKLAADLSKGNAGGTSISGLDDANSIAGTVTVKSIKPQNFVFATLTEEEINLKRKTEDLLNSSGENGGINYMKKPKIEPRRDKCFIDQLL